MKSTSRFAKVAVSAGLIVATGAGVLGVTSFASAQISDSTPRIVEVTTSDDTAPDSSYNHSSSMGMTHASRGAMKLAPLSVAATVLGMKEDDLYAELEAGKSIAQVAEAAGVDVQKVIDAIVAHHSERIAAHVAEGKLTQEQADAMLARTKEMATSLVNNVGLPAHGEKGEHRSKMGHAKFVSEGLASVLKLSVTELHTQLRNGKSLAAIAEAQNVDIAKVKDVLTSEFKAHLDEAVATGKHTQSEVDTKLEQFTTRLDDMVNGVRPQAEMRGGGMRGGGEMRGGRHGGGGHGTHSQL